MHVAQNTPHRTYVRDIEIYTKEWENPTRLLGPYRLNEEGRAIKDKISHNFKNEITKKIENFMQSSFCIDEFFFDNFQQIVQIMMHHSTGKELFESEGRKVGKFHSMTQ